MKSTFTHPLSGLLLSFLLFCACASSPKAYQVEPILYKKDFEVQYRLSHEAPTFSTLHLIVESDDYEVSFQAYSTSNKNIIYAEDKIDVREDASSLFQHTFEVRPEQYFLKIFIKDHDQQRVFRDIIQVNKNTALSQLKITQDQKPLVRNHVPIDTEILLEHPDLDVLFVKYFDRTFKAAAPPFSSKGYKFNPRRDVTQFVEVPNGTNIKLEGQGLYFIQTDTSALDGIFINVFEDRYPRISSAQQMVESIRYITKMDEYKALSASGNTKEAIDQFWVSRSRDKAFAKEMIKTYYTRVQIANRDFTTYKEGWKTDRGMIYLIFGPPDDIRKSATSETWLYGSSGKRNAVKFEFKKKHGQSLLIRSDYLKRPWDVEVFEWRKGILNE